jgi:flagellar biosynthesis chaperone FliJ
MDENEKIEVKNKIAQLKADRKALREANGVRVKEYRQCAEDGRQLSAQIKELEASVRGEKATVKLESLTVEQVEKLLADLKAKNADDGITD